MTLAQLVALTYKYLATDTDDPAYPKDTVVALLNAAGHKYVADIQDANPGYLRKIVTLTPEVGTRTYDLPLDFAGVMVVRSKDQDGARLHPVRDDELEDPAFASWYALTGPDQAAQINVSREIVSGATLWMKYRYQPADLVADGDSPTWMPLQFHDLLAREAAVDAFGLGDEAVPSPFFVDELKDRRGQFWGHISRRNTEIESVRSR